MHGDHASRNIEFADSFKNELDALPYIEKKVSKAKTLGELSHSLGDLILDTHVNGGELLEQISEQSQLIAQIDEKLTLNPHDREVDELAQNITPKYGLQDKVWELIEDTRLAAGRTRITLRSDDITSVRRAPDEETRISGAA